MLSPSSLTPHPQVRNNTPWWCLSSSSMEEILLFVDFHPRASPKLCLSTYGKHGACRVNQGAGEKLPGTGKVEPVLKLFWSKGSTVLYKNQQQPQKIELQWWLLAVNRKSQVACHAHCTALSGSLWHIGGMSLPHWISFFEKSYVLERNSVILEGVERNEQGYENLLGNSKFLSCHRFILIS